MRRGCPAAGLQRSSFLGLVFHAVAAALDENRLGMVEESIQDRRGNGTVVGKDRRPLFERFVGGEDDRAAFVALTDDLEEEISAALVDGQVADLVELC